MSIQIDDSVRDDNRTIRRGDVVTVELDGARGVEKRGARPVVVVQADYLNDSLSSATVVPVTRRGGGGGGGSHAHDVRIGPNQAGVDEGSYVECNQARTVDLDERMNDMMGWLSDGYMDRIDRALANALGLAE